MGRSRKGRASNNNEGEEACNICKGMNTSSDLGSFLCDSCNKWNHASCAEVKTVAEFKELEAKEKRFCPTCLKNSNMETIVIKVASKIANEVKCQTTTTLINESLIDEITKLVKIEFQNMWSNNVAQLKAEIEGDHDKQIEQLNCEITSLKVKVESFKSLQRKKNVLIHGLPANLSIGNHEFVAKIANEIGFKSLSHFDIDRVVRFNRNSSKYSPIVQVSFTAQSVKEDFMYQYAKYVRENQLQLKCIDNTSNSIIYINEHLEKKDYILSSRARFLKKDGVLDKYFFKKRQFFVLFKGSTTPTVIRHIEELSASSSSHRRLSTEDNQKNGELSNAEFFNTPNGITAESTIIELKT